MKVLITGGAGFIGSALAERLCGANRVTLFDNLHRNATVGTSLLDEPNITLVRGDVMDKAAMAVQSVFLFTLLGCEAAKDGANRARWCNQDFDDLLMQAKITADVAKRTGYYEKAQLIFKEEAPCVVRVQKPDWHAMPLSPFGAHLQKNALAAKPKRLEASARAWREAAGGGAASDGGG